MVDHCIPTEGNLIYLYKSVEQGVAEVKVFIKSNFMKTKLHYLYRTVVVAVFNSTERLGSE